MTFETVEGIREAGFDGFVPISGLQASNCCEVPDAPGVYLVLRLSTTRPDFLNKSTGGYFKKKDPTVSVSLLEERWVKDAIVLNIGTAGPGKTATLKNRLRAYMQFGQGKPVGHMGGRYIWQLSHSRDLLVCWKMTGNISPRVAEQELIRGFEETYHRLPFANLNH